MGPFASAVADRHGQWLDWQAVERQSGSVTFFLEGSMLKISGGSLPHEYEDDRRGKRGRCAGFSSRSRTAMMGLLASLRRDALPLFVTLTYPARWPVDPLEWKRHLHVFGVYLRRRFPGCSFVWKMEPQQRGAPHFHLLLYGTGDLPIQEVCRRWAVIVDPVDGLYGAHCLCGVDVQRCRSWADVAAYCSKRYIGKEVSAPAGFSFVGRWWGVVGRADLPRSKEFTEDVGQVVLNQFRRIARRFAQGRIKAEWLRKRSLGKKVPFYPLKQKRVTRVFTSDPIAWGRVLDLCLGIHYERRQAAGDPF